MLGKTTIFIVSQWDIEMLNSLLHEYKEPYSVISENTQESIETEIGRLIFAISPFSVDSTSYQELVLKYLKAFENVESYVLRLNSAKVPVGFGRLCELSDMLIE